MTEKRYADIAEYVSRPARMRLVELCLAAIEKQLEAVREKQEKKGKRGRPLEAESFLADRLHVSAKTVKRWRKDVFQAKNINAKLLLTAALDLDNEGVGKILVDDLKRHRQELYYLIDISEYEKEEARGPLQGTAQEIPDAERAPI